MPATESRQYSRETGSHKVPAIFGLQLDGDLPFDRRYYLGVLLGCAGVDGRPSEVLPMTNHFTV
jgi:hypothetical protein